MKLACALLAAGASKRFGSNKLLYQLDGQSLLERTLMLHGALPYCQKLMVTRRTYAVAAALGREYGFTVLYNDAPERGAGSSAAIAAEALLKSDAAGALFSVCDQPYLTGASVERLLAAFERQPERIVAAAHGGVRGNPCLFPRQFFGELAALSGEQGGAAVIARHMNDLTLVEVADAWELTDIDAPPEDRT